MFTRAVPTIKSNKNSLYKHQKSFVVQLFVLGNNFYMTMLFSEIYEGGLKSSQPNNEKTNL